ncbi:Putative RxLR effector [Phytophthora palmivora]|uniref:RxLR effector n=1 Tax=Phytophthora palmivora TaxID=4796 RepID=A0A2P4Y6V9_9STRA|nr:Putative RxLR effector [Phytophthora palmivora]
MYLLGIFLLAVTVLLTPANGAGRQHTHYTNFSRFLRITDVDGVRSEERVILPGLSKIQELALKLTPLSQEKAQLLWLKLKTRPEVVFNSLHLGETVLKLDDNPRLLQWFNYVKAHKSKIGGFTDEDIYKLLSKRTDDGELAVLFYSLEKTPKFERLGTRMRSLVFEKWLNNDMRPGKAKVQLELIGRDTSSLPDLALREKILAEYSMEFLLHLDRKKYRAHLDELMGTKYY